MAFAWCRHKVREKSPARVKWSRMATAVRPRAGWGHNPENVKRHDWLMERIHLNWLFFGVSFFFFFFLFILFSVLCHLFFVSCVVDLSPALASALCATLARSLGRLQTDIWKFQIPTSRERGVVGQTCKVVLGGFIGLCEDSMGTLSVGALVCWLCGGYYL